MECRRVVALRRKVASRLEVRAVYSRLLLLLCLLLLQLQLLETAPARAGKPRWTFPTAVFVGVLLVFRRSSLFFSQGFKFFAPSGVRPVVSVR